jgi:hypothetical protein
VRAAIRRPRKANQGRSPEARPRAAFRSEARRVGDKRASMTFVICTTAGSGEAAFAAEGCADLRPIPVVINQSASACHGLAMVSEGRALQSPVSRSRSATPADRECWT